VVPLAATRGGIRELAMAAARGWASSRSDRNASSAGSCSSRRRTATTMAQQLAALDAILAFPDPDNLERYLTSSSTTLPARAPVKAQVEDLAQIQRIYWVDDKLSSVRSLAGGAWHSRRHRHSSRSSRTRWSNNSWAAGTSNRRAGIKPEDSILETAVRYDPRSWAADMNCALKAQETR